MKFNATDEAIDALASKIPCKPDEVNEKAAFVFLAKRLFGSLERIALAAERIAEARNPAQPVEGQRKLL